MLCFTASPLRAQTWTGTTGSWFTGSNWSSGSQPNSSSTSYVDNGGTAQVSTNSGVTQTLEIGYNGTGNLLIQNGGTISNQYTIIGDSTSSVGIVTVTGSGALLTSSTSSTTSNGIVYVGGNGTGTLNVTNGGDVLTETMWVGYNSGSTGTVKIDGAGSNLTVSGNFCVGQSGTGTMTLSGGAKAYSASTTYATWIGGLAGSQGTVTVTGSGSVWSTSSLWVGWGGNNGTTSGTLNINSAGAVSSSIGIVGDLIAARGTVNVSGGTWTISNTLSLGQSGTGSLNISNVGTVTASNVNLGTSSTGTGIINVSDTNSLLTSGALSVGQSGTGIVTITNGGDIASTTGVVGANSGSSGTVTINGTGSTWTASGGIIVGSNGTGTVNIANGGQLATSTVSIGSNAGSSGTVNVDGTTANSWNTLTVGDAGTGNLLVTNGATLTTATTLVGASATGSGTVTVSGATSRLVVTNNNLVVGSGGRGSLILENGGTVTSSTVTAGSASGSIGNITLSGGTTAAGWTNLALGVNGTGTVTVTNGADLTTATTTLGSTVGSTGSALISGAGSNMTVSGTLVVGSSGTGTIVIENQGALRGGAIVLGSAVGSTGTILLNGAGSTLTYTSITVGGSGSGVITVANGATLAPGATLTLSSTSLGSGTLNIGAAAGAAATGAGIINTTNISTAAGGTGTIQFNHTSTGYYLTNDGTSGGTAVNIRSGTAVTQNGGVTIIKAGGTNDYTGATTVNGGTLSVAGNITNTNRVVVTGGSLLDGGTIVTTNTTISGGALSVSGTFTTTNMDITGGTVSASGTLNSTNTRINGGTLFLDTNLTSTVTVTSGQLIMKTGRTLTGNVRSTNGTFGTAAYFDNSLPAGAITISGNLTLGSGSTTGLRAAEVTPGSFDVLHVTGTATLAGTLALNFNNATGYIPKTGDSFVIMNAGAFDGNFTSFTNVMENYFIFTTGTYSGNDYTATVSMAQKSFTTSAVTGNQMAVAQALNKEIRPGSTMQPAIDYLNTLPESSWGQAFDLIAPEELTAAPNAGLANASSLYNMLGNRFNEVRSGQRFSDNGLVMWDPSREFNRNSLLASNGPLPEGYQTANPSIFNDSRFGMFISGQGTFGDISGNNDIDGYNFNAGGLILGCDYRIAEHTAIGVYGGYQGTDTDLNNSGNAKTDSGKFGVYVSQWWDQGAWINASIGGGYNSYTNKRAALGDFANSNTTGMEFNFQAQQGYDFHVGRWTFGPTLQVDYTNLSIDGYTESGSLAPLKINSQTAESLQGTIGGRVTTSIDVNHSQWKVMPYANVGLRHEFLDTQQAVTAAFANGSGGTFSVDGPKTDANSIVAGFGVTLQLSPRWSGQLGYFAQANEDYLIQSITGSVVFSF